jgi:hypothetical protein
MLTFRQQHYLTKGEEWIRAEIASTQREIDDPEAARGRGADGYYALKDRLRELSGALARKSPLEHDPMGFWFGGQSN